MVIVLKTASRVYPSKKFEIEKLPNGKCVILFYTNIKRNEFKQRYEYDLYRYETIYRPELQNIIENDYDKWLEIAKSNVKVVNKRKDELKVNKDLELDSDIKDIFGYIIALEERIMQLELEIADLKDPRPIKLKSRRPEHFDLSPYEKMLKVIKQKKLSREEILKMLKNFVDNKYMTEDEFSELFDLLYEEYGGDKE